MSLAYILKKFIAFYSISKNLMVRPFQELSGSLFPLFLVDSGNKLEFTF